MYLRHGQTHAARDRQAPALEAGLEHGLQGHALRREAQAPAASAARSFRRSSTSRSSTAATCAARAAGSMWPPSRRRSRRTRSTSWSARPRRWATSSSASSAASRSCTRTCSTCSAEHPDCYFQIFTNGQFITDEKAKRLRQLGNVTPLISVEGNEIVSDERRGRRRRPAARRWRASQNCLKQQGLHRRLHQPVPDEHRRPADREVGRSADRDGRDVHLVPRLSADGARRQSATCA